MSRSLLAIAITLGLTASMGAQDVPPAALPAVVSQPTTPDYTISPDDVLDVYILDVPELSRSYRVSPSGTVTLPLLASPLTAAGLTLSRFSQVVAGELQRSSLVSQPYVTTSVQQSRLHSVAVTGAVKKPQIYPLLAPSTLMDVLSQAEGLADDAGGEAIIYRGEFAGRTLGWSAAAEPTTKVDLKRILERSDPSANVPVYPGDRVTVPRAGIVYVVGAVNRPGGFPIKASKQPTTLIQALALAEDTKSTAITTQTVIIRIDPSTPSGRRQIPVDVKRVLAGKAKDPALEADDVVFVPDSRGRKALRRGIEAALQTATGVLIFRP